MSLCGPCTTVSLKLQLAPSGPALWTKRSLYSQKYASDLVRPLENSKHWYAAVLSPELVALVQLTSGRQDLSKVRHIQLPSRSILQQVPMAHCALLVIVGSLVIISTKKTSSGYLTVSLYPSAMQDYDGLHLEAKTNTVRVFHLRLILYRYDPALGTFIPAPPMPAGLNKQLVDAAKALQAIGTGSPTCACCTRPTKPIICLVVML